jgi:hypothetical protein
MKEVQLTKGYVALVDDEDYESLSAYTWYAVIRKHTVYARTHWWQGGVRKNVSMHRMILNPIVGLEVDHLNHNGLDNRRQNIRISTRSENAYNREYYGKGVQWYPQRLKWRVIIKGKYVGLFATKEDAEKAHAAAIAAF